MATDAQISSGITASPVGVRTRNERLILSLIQRFGAAPGADLARQAGLSAQTVSVLLRRLESDGLLTRGTPQRGRVGKPSVPMDLAADGTFSIGLKIGRRSADLALMDFHGTVRGQIQVHYRYPMPDTVFGFLTEGIATLLAELPPDHRTRVCGIGIAAPYEIWKWSEALGAPFGDFAIWEEIDLAAEIRARTGYDATVLNDATAACMAEHALGRGQGPGHRTYAYLFVGSFIGGGVVMDDTVVHGPHGNAAAFGPIQSTRPDGSAAPLLDTASLYVLEDAITHAGGDPAALWEEPRDWSRFEAELDPWILTTGTAIARALVTICAVIDFEAIVVDGAFPPDVRARLGAHIRRTWADLDTRGLISPVIEEGRVGDNARAIGAAYAPIAARYLMPVAHPER